MVNLRFIQVPPVFRRAYKARLWEIDMRGFRKVESEVYDQTNTSLSSGEYPINTAKTIRV